MDLIERLLEERNTKLHGGIYDITQKRFAYHSNKIEGSSLTENQVSFIYDTKIIANIGERGIRIDDVIEMANHFKCFDYILDTVNEPLTEAYIKKIHQILKSGTSLEYSPLASVGAYKLLPNIVGNMETTPVERVEEEMRTLLIGYNLNNAKELEYLTTFHANFEKIHPFADGNGRVGRLLLFKECLKEGIVPFIIDVLNKKCYYSALKDLQLRDNKEPLLTYFQGEQKNYINDLKNKNFDGKVNHAKEYSQKV